MSRWFREQLIDTHINLLNKFDDNATPAIFEEIFGKSIGEHLCSKYIRSFDGSVCRLYRSLDDENRAKLCEYLNSQGQQHAS